MIKIVTLEYKIESNKVTNLQLGSPNSLLDYDVVVIDSSKIYTDFIKKHGTTDRVFNILTQTRDEVAKLLNRGKVVIAFLVPYSGDSRNEFYTNYAWLPPTVNAVKNSIVGRSGNELELVDPNNQFSPYFKAFKGELTYNAYINSTYALPTVNKISTTRTGESIGFYFQFQNDGKLVFLPPPPMSNNHEKLLGVIMQCALPSFDSSKKEVEPEWAKDYFVFGTEEKEKFIAGLELQIEDLNDEKTRHNNELNQLLEYKILLYGKGIQLQDTVTKSLRLLDINADKFQKKEMDHDIILKTDGKIAVAEVEGKDSAPINLDKIDQLSRVVDEYYTEHKEKLSDLPEGILIANPYRLVKLEERKEPFSEHAVKVVTRKGFIMLLTSDLFKVVCYILENPSDDIFKKNCRDLIFSSRGKLVDFSSCLLARVTVESK